MALNLDKFITRSRENLMRAKNSFESIINKYNRPFQDSEEIDISTFSVYEKIDNGPAPHKGNSRTESLPSEDEYKLDVSQAYSYHDTSVAAVLSDIPEDVLCFDSEEPSDAETLSSGDDTDDDEDEDDLSDLYSTDDDYRENETPNRALKPDSLGAPDNKVIITAPKGQSSLALSRVKRSVSSSSESSSSDDEMYTFQNLGSRSVLHKEEFEKIPSSVKGQRKEVILLDAWAKDTTNSPRGVVISCLDRSASTSPQHTRTPKNACNKVKADDCFSPVKNKFEHSERTCGTQNLPESEDDCINERTFVVKNSPLKEKTPRRVNYTLLHACKNKSAEPSLSKSESRTPAKLCKANSELKISPQNSIQEEIISMLLSTEPYDPLKPLPGAVDNSRCGHKSTSKKLFETSESVPVKKQSPKELQEAFQQMQKTKSQRTSGTVTSGKNVTQTPDKNFKAGLDESCTPLKATSCNIKQTFDMIKQSVTPKLLSQPPNQRPAACSTGAKLKSFTKKNATVPNRKSSGDRNGYTRLKQCEDSESEAVNLTTSEDEESNIESLSTLDTTVEDSSKSKAKSPTKVVEELWKIDLLPSEMEVPKFEWKTPTGKRLKCEKMMSPSEIFAQMKLSSPSTNIYRPEKSNGDLHTMGQKPKNQMSSTNMVSPSVQDYKNASKESDRQPKQSVQDNRTRKAPRRLITTLIPVDTNKVSKPFGSVNIYKTAEATVPKGPVAKTLENVDSTPLKHNEKSDKIISQGSSRKPNRPVPTFFDSGSHAYEHLKDLNAVTSTPSRNNPKALSISDISCISDADENQKIVASKSAKALILNDKSDSVVNQQDKRHGTVFSLSKNGKMPHSEYKEVENLQDEMEFSDLSENEEFQTLVPLSSSEDENLYRSKQSAVSVIKKTCKEHLLKPTGEWHSFSKRKPSTASQKDRHRGQVSKVKNKEKLLRGYSPKRSRTPSSEMDTDQPLAKRSPLVAKTTASNQTARSSLGNSSARILSKEKVIHKRLESLQKSNNYSSEDSGTEQDSLCNTETSICLGSEKCTKSFCFECLSD